METRLADLEDGNRSCNICIVWLKVGLEGSSAIQYLTRSLPKLLPDLADVQIDIMRAHQVYSSRPENNNTATCTLIFNVLRYSTRQAILQAAPRSPATVVGGKIRFFPRLQQL